MDDQLPPGGQPWPTDQYGRPWPVDQFGRPWPSDPWGRPMSPYLAPSGQVAGAPTGTPPPSPLGPPAVGSAISPGDPRLYPGAPATLIDAVARERTSGRRVKIANWGLWDPVIGLLLWLALGVVGGIVSIATDKSGSAAAGIGLIVAVTLPWLALVGWPALITGVRGNGLFVDLGIRWRWSDIGWGVLWGLAAVVVAVILAVATQALFGEFSSSAGDLAEDLAENKLIFAVFLLTIMIGAPIAEEIFFRGFLFGALVKKRLPPVWAVVVSAAVFSLIHLEPVRIILLFGIGLILGLARWLTRSTTTAIVAHVVNNSVSSIGLIYLLFQ